MNELKNSGIILQLRMHNIIFVLTQVWERMILKRAGYETTRHT
jgi:hypothetical protein